MTWNEESARDLMAALGGAGNIVHLDACMVRLRVEVKNPRAVSTEILTRLGASGVFRSGNRVQAVFGLVSERMKRRLMELMAGRTPEEADLDRSGPFDPSAQNRAARPLAEEEFVSPVNGELLELDAVPDPVFAGKLLGDGFAFRSEDGIIASPVNGRVFNVFPSKHAIGIMTERGTEVLIHVGVNTVKLKGEGFNVLVSEGDTVSAGQPVLEADIELIRERAPSDISPVLLSNLPEGFTVVLNTPGAVSAGDNGIISIKPGIL